MTLESILTSAGRGIAAAGCYAGRKAKSIAWDHGYQNWNKVKPVAGFALGFAATKTLADLTLIPLGETSFFSHTIPGIIDYLNFRAVDTSAPLLNTAAHFADSAMRFTYEYTRPIITWGISIAGGIYVATRNAFKRDTQAGRRRPNNWTKIKAVAGLGLCAASIAASSIATPEIRRQAGSFIQKAYHGIVGTDISRILDLEKKDEPLSETIDAIMTAKNVDKTVLAKNVGMLRGIGYNGMTERDLYFMVRAVAGEAGNYAGSRDAAERQADCINGVAHVIINRYNASHNYPRFKRDFNGPGAISFEKIVLNKNITKKRNAQGRIVARTRYEFDIAASERNRQSWEEGFRKGQIAYHKNQNDIAYPKKFNEAKIMLAYVGTLKALIEARRGVDPTKGALFYKNNEFSSQVWDGTMSPDKEYINRFVVRIQDHWYYALFRKGGKKVDTSLP